MSAPKLMNALTQYYTNLLYTEAPLNNTIMNLYFSHYQCVRAISLFSALQKPCGSVSIQVPLILNSISGTRQCKTLVYCGMCLAKENFVERGQNGSIMESFQVLCSHKT